MFLLGFDRFIAPTMIRVFYFIGLVAAVFGGLGVIVYALIEMDNLGTRQTIGMIGAALIGTPICILLLRFAAEMWLVMFEVNKRLGALTTRNKS